MRRLFEAWQQEDADVYSAFASEGYYRHGRAAVIVVQVGRFAMITAWAAIAVMVVKKVLL